MQKIMFNERYGLEDAAIAGSKTNTRREPFYCDAEIESFIDSDTSKLRVCESESRRVVHISRFAVGEVVAIAQSYEKVRNFYFENDWDDERTIAMMEYAYDKGWRNKMFVKAELMPQHIRITNIRCERLQDISNNDCLKEGIIEDLKGVQYSFSAPLFCGNYPFDTPRGAFSVLINKLSGKGFWESNPYVIVYEFEIMRDYGRKENDKRRESKSDIRSM